MKIKEINLIEFGGLKDCRIALSDGLNVLEGDNEAGKSTILLFIKFMLYGLGRKNQEDYERAVSRSGHCARGTMTLTVSGEDYRIERDFAEGMRSGSERIHVLRLSDGEELSLAGQPGEHFLGVVREVFESSCYVGQMKLTGVSDKKGSDAIRNLLSSADETTDVTRVVDKLDKIRVTYRKKTGKGGRLYELSGALADQRVRYDRAVENHRRILVEQERFDRFEAQNAENEAAIERVNAVLRGIAKIGLLRRFERLRLTEADWTRLLEARQNAKEKFLKTDYIPTASDVATLRHLADRADEAETAYRAAVAALEARTHTATDDQKARHAEQLAARGGYAALERRVGSLRTRTKLFACLCAIGVIAGAAALLLFPIAAVAGGAIAALFGVLLAVNASAGKRLAADYASPPRALLSYARECEAYARQIAEEGAAAERLSVELRVAEEQLTQAQARLVQTLQRTLPNAEAPNADGARAEADRIEQYLRADREAEIRLRSLSNTVDAERDALAEYDEQALRAEIDPSLWDMTPDQIAHAERQQKFCADKKKTLETSMRQSQIELISARAGFTSPVEIADRLVQLEEESARAERYADALELAIESLESAAKSMSGSVTPALTKDAGAMMKRLSGGRYVELSAGTTLTPTLLLEDGRSVPLDLMSGGTRDAAYLSLRIALMMQIYAGELPPLLLDEALCQLDDKRTAEVLGLLAGMGGEQAQILLFTCHRREAEICRRDALACHTVSLS